MVIMKVTKAFILVAGLGTRFYPITKTISKGMLPVYNRPLVDYVVEDCIKAGIKHIYLAAAKGETQYKSYYTENLALRKELSLRQSNAAYEKIADIHTKAQFHFLEHDYDEFGRGTAGNVLVCEPHVMEGESVLIVAGDDFIYNRDGSSELQRFIRNVEEADLDSGLCAATVPYEKVSQYGALSIDDKHLLTGIVEKPQTNAPSNLINISKYLLTADIFPHIRGLKMHPNQELMIVEALLSYANEHPLYVHEIEGQYLDGGTPDDLLNASLVISRDQT